MRFNFFCGQNSYVANFWHVFFWTLYHKSAVLFRKGINLSIVRLQVDIQPLIWPTEHHRSGDNNAVGDNENDILGCSKEFGQRLPSNIGLLLRKLWVVVRFHSRRLTICKHSCVRHISWAFRSAINGKQTMFTNHKASAMEADNNSQLTQ